MFRTHIVPHCKPCGHVGGTMRHPNLQSSHIKSIRVLSWFYWKRSGTEKSHRRQNSCHNFVTLRTKFSVIRPYRKTNYVTNISCVNLYKPQKQNGADNSFTRQGSLVRTQYRPPFESSDRNNSADYRPCLSAVPAFPPEEPSSSRCSRSRSNQ